MRQMIHFKQDTTNLVGFGQNLFDSLFVSFESDCKKLVIVKKICQAYSLVYIMI